VQNFVLVGMRTLIFIDLSAGAGGLSESFIRAGLYTLAHIVTLETVFLSFKSSEI
jgi:site-specific DNA-cytosine methylase